MSILRFMDGDRKTLVNAFEWEQDWPPPERLTLLSLTPDMQTVIAVLVTEEIASWEALTEFWFPMKFVRGQTAEVDAMKNAPIGMLRGAEYTPEEVRDGVPSGDPGEPGR